MANTKSAKKRLRQNATRRVRNMAVTSRVKTFTKHAMAAIEANDKERLATVLPTALAEIDRAAGNGVIHKNTAARKKSILQKRAAAIQQ